MWRMSWKMPDTITTERLTIRRYTLADAEALTDLTARNKAHLVRFMAWAKNEPQTLEQRREFLTGVEEKFAAGEDFTMGLFERTTGELIGSTGFHARTEPVPYLEIGYWIDADHEGKGLITEASAAQTRVALEYCHSPMVGVVHAPANVRSEAVPKRLGYTRQPANDGATCTDSGEKVPQVEWLATASTLTHEPLASFARPDLYDRDGNALPWPKV